MTSGTIAFQETSAVVGDIILVDCAWTDAKLDSDLGQYADMWLKDPAPPGVKRDTHRETSDHTGFATLGFRTDKAGMWEAEIWIFDGTKYLKYYTFIMVSGDGDILLANALTCESCTGWQNHGEKVTVFDPLKQDKIWCYLEWGPTSHDFYGETIGFKWIHNGEVLFETTFDVVEHWYGIHWCINPIDWGKFLYPGTGHVEAYHNGVYLGKSNDYTVSPLPVPTGTVKFQETSAKLGDTIHADCSWTNATPDPDGLCGAGRIYDPDGIERTWFKRGWGECPDSSKAWTIEWVTDKPGIWTAVVDVYNGAEWVRFTDTLKVSDATVRFREMIVNPGDSIHADFTWIGAVVSPELDCANMHIYDPTGTSRAFWEVKGTNCPDGIHMLECITDIEGTWTAELNVYDGTKWATFTASASVGLKPVAIIETPLDGAKVKNPVSFWGRGEPVESFRQLMWYDETGPFHTDFDQSDSTVSKTFSLGPHTISFIVFSDTGGWSDWTTIEIEVVPPQPEICIWIEAKGGPAGITSLDVYELVTSYTSGSNVPGYTFIPTSLMIYGVIQYYNGEDGDSNTGCDFFP